MLVTGISLLHLLADRGNTPSRVALVSPPQRNRFASIHRSVPTNPNYWSPPHSQRTYSLFAGAAGFIGMHVSIYLVQYHQAHVVGIDNLNGYYSRELKAARIAYLRSTKIPLVVYVSAWVLVLFYAAANGRTSIQHWRPYRMTPPAFHGHSLMTLHVQCSQVENQCVVLLPHPPSNGVTLPWWCARCSCRGDVSESSVATSEGALPTHAA